MKLLPARRAALAAAVSATLLLAAPAAPAEGPTRGEPVRATRAAGPITVDGDLSDPGWHGAEVVDGWLETNPGDNVAARVANRARIVYDERFLYVGFEFEDPEPAAIRAPLGDRDDTPSYTDYAGILLDTRNDGRTAMMFLANPRGVQYDAITADAGGGEDNSPDFFWDAAGRITEGGWNLEMRIPFSTLRYEGTAPEMGILFYRNWPRDFRTQMFAGPLPRGEDCFVCHSHPLTGFQDLPGGGSLVIAPFATADQVSAPRDGLGSALATGSVEATGGVDVKWLPNPNLALDATLNPDFSQIEADVPRIAANERFAVFFAEKRPFFLEGVELFDSPLDAVYTRTITDPAWGARATGTLGDTRYTLLVSEDEGGGSVILPGPNTSSLARQDFRSTNVLARVRRDLGRSFVSFLTTAREIEGGAYNRVYGPDFQWRPTSRDTVAGQLLLSESETPVRPDLASEWDGRRLSGHAADLWWAHSDARVDWFLNYKDLADEFRADSGFIPQVGVREGYGEAGYTYRPEGPVRRVRTFLIADYTADRDGDLAFRGVSPGVSLDGRWSSFLRLRAGFDRVRSGERVFSQEKLFYTAEWTPSRVFSRVAVDGEIGDQVDFANHRPATGGTLNLFSAIRPSDHLELRIDASRRWLDVDEGDARGRLLTAQVARLRGQYTFNARSYLRLIGQWAESERDPALYLGEVTARDGGLSGSALFAYKLDWQTVLFVGFSDDRALLGAEDGRVERFEPAGRQAFLKISYAFQR
ncbi:MAG TPA: DUF5916 domain-containing protein [Thermoanaerobaculia bacterium]|nr:DUF5916 domain-containing protein [Thermoanaerobaculia bacterium]